MLKARVLDDRAAKIFEQQVPLASTFDVVVAGGGVSGIIAAAEAARNGAKVAVVEANGFLGGTATAALMAAMVFSDEASGLPLEFLQRLSAAGGSPAWDPDNPYRSRTTPFDVEIYKQVAADLLAEAGVSILPYAPVVGVLEKENGVAGLIIATKRGLRAIRAGMVVDCTGDADVAYMAGAKFRIGREGDGKQRPISLLFRLGGLDLAALYEWAQAHLDQIQSHHRYGTWLSVGQEHVITRLSGFFDLIEAGHQAGELPAEIHYLRFESCWVERGMAVVNSTRVYNVDGTRVEDLALAERQAREQMRQLITFIRRRVPGCSQAFLLDSATRLGVRETRRIVGEHYLDEEDVYGDRRFPDAIKAMALLLPPKSDLGVRLDIHMPDPVEGSASDILERDRFAVLTKFHAFQIPSGVLVPKDLDGVLVAGRAVSVCHFIDGWTRNQLVAMSFGQAAGAMAALAVKTGMRARDLPGALIVQTLERHGVKNLSTFSPERPAPIAAQASGTGR